MAQDDDVAPAGLVFVAGEYTTEHGWDTQHSEEAGLDAAGLHHLGLADPREVVSGEAVDCGLLKDVILAFPIQVIRRRKRKPRHSRKTCLRRRVPQLNQSVGIGEG